MILDDSTTSALPLIASLCVVSANNAGIPNGRNHGIPPEAPHNWQQQSWHCSEGLRGNTHTMNLYKKVDCDCGEGEGEGYGYKAMGYRRQLYQKHRADCNCGGSAGGANGKAIPSGANFGIPSEIPTTGISLDVSSPEFLRNLPRKFLRGSK
jgi:hypothetical protein